MEDRFDLYVLRYYPSSGGSDPLVIPIGGVRQGGTAIAAPPGAVQKFNLIYQLAHRMIAQAERADDPLYRSMARHPLMQPGPYRRDNLAMLLATVTAQKIIGLDSTFEAYQSDFCRKMHRGREVFEKFLLTQWALTPERPLLQWVIDESPLSAFVEATRAPLRAVDSLAPAQEYVEGLPIKGQLGLSVKIGDNNRLVLDQVDTLRLAYACGLRVGDVIRLGRRQTPADPPSVDRVRSVRARPGRLDRLGSAPRGRRHRGPPSGRFRVRQGPSRSAGSRRPKTPSFSNRPLPTRPGTARPGRADPSFCRYID